jgi:hypothetical protein
MATKNGTKQAKVAPKVPEPPDKGGHPVTASLHGGKPAQVTVRLEEMSLFHRDAISRAFGDGDNKSLPIARALDFFVKHDKDAQYHLKRLLEDRKRVKK